jgi:hypothetical protein
MRQTISRGRESFSGQRDDRRRLRLGPSGVQSGKRRERRRDILRLCQLPSRPRYRTTFRLRPLLISPGRSASLPHSGFNMIGPGAQSNIIALRFALTSVLMKPRFRRYFAPGDTNVW